MILARQLERWAVGARERPLVGLPRPSGSRDAVGPATIPSDNTFTQNASNYNTSTNVDAFLVLGRLGLLR